MSLCGKLHDSCVHLIVLIPFSLWKHASGHFLFDSMSDIM